MVHFSADWADQCGPVTEVLKELLKLPEVQSSNSKFGVCDAEHLSEISLKYKVCMEYLMCIIISINL